MSWPERAGALVGQMDVHGSGERFPFTWWALANHFTYHPEFRALFSKCGSAAEAYFLRPFTERVLAAVDGNAATYLGVRVIPQHPIGKYFADFAVHDGSTRLAVEVDGLAFHQRTADQVEADYLRARRLTASGYTVVRFTAAEVFRDAAECWRQLDAILDARRPKTPRPA